MDPEIKRARTRSRSHLSLIDGPTPGPGQPRREVDREHGCVLLTGATGFVGGQLLLRLLARDARTILCLVRADNDAEARQRGADRLRALLHREPRPGETRRIEWIRADLEQRRLGLSPEDWAFLGGRIQEIFHCAASVDFDLPLEEARRVNVDGVEKLLALACAAGKGFDRFHHVSTAYAAGRTRRRIGPDFLPPDSALSFRNTYERTKAQAERLLRSQQDVPVTIYRPSIIAGDTTTGETDNWNVLYVPMRQIFRGRLPFLRRGGKAIADTVGIDFVVDGIVALSACRDRRVQAFHLTADRLAFDVERYVRACNRAARRNGLGIETRAIGPRSWNLRVGALRLMSWVPASLGRWNEIGRSAMRGLDSFRPYLAYTSVSAEFDAEWEHRYLQAFGVRMPDPDAYLDRIIAYALEHAFGESPQKQMTICDVEASRPTRLVEHSVAGAF